MDSATKEIMIGLLEDTFGEEICHLRLRRIREDQAPRFDALKAAHPEINSDFLKARAVHDQLRDARRRRIATLTKMIEGK